MFRKCVVICLSTGLCTTITWAQYNHREQDVRHEQHEQPEPQNRHQHRHSPDVAYVYVSNSPLSGSGNQIQAFETHEDGRLFPIHGAPFNFDDVALSGSGNNLFAVNRSTPEIDHYAIEPDGAVRYLNSTNYAAFDPNNCGGTGWLFSDRTGSDLYAMVFLGDCANNTYQLFSLASPTGQPNYVGSANGGAGSFGGVYLPATFLGNNSYAYEVSMNSCMYFGIWGFHRESSGLLTEAAISVTRPDPPPGFRVYYPAFAAADSTNHVAIALLPLNPPGCTPDEKVQIASFTADENGNLTTTNTYATMPTSSISGVTDLKISPAGDVLAIGGPEGLQLFHFNGAEAPTSYTGVLTVDPVTQMFWDDSDHLYVISQQASRLHVFNVTGSEYHEAPGSPYQIDHPSSLAIHTLD
jgi:hypothetical protein